MKSKTLNHQPSTTNPRASGFTLIELLVVAKERNRNP